MNWGKNFMSIFKYGLKRAGSRLLIKLLGKKAAATLLGKGAVTAATTATTATTATAATTSTAATAGGVGVAGATGIVAGVGLLASGLGEGAYQLTKMGDGFVEYWEKSYKEKNRFDPRRVIDFGIFKIMQTLNLGLGNLGVLLDIVGAPFRYLVELIRYPFLDEAGKAKQRGNLAKFDARIRDQFRKTLNFFTFGLGFKEEGSFGSLYGKEGTEGMGYDDKEKVSKKIEKEKNKIVSKGNANNIVSTNGISNKVNNISSYSEEEETVIVKSGSETRGDVVPETETKESITPVVIGGGGGSREIDEALYKSG
jgi:hypothetical protein